MNQDVSLTHGAVIAGLCNDPADGERALADLKAAGFTKSEISQAGGEDAAVASAAAPAVAGAFFREHDSPASSFLDELLALGFSKHDAHDLVDGLVEGAALITADAGAEPERAVTILTNYHADVRYTTGSTEPEVDSVAARASVDDATRDADRDREIQLRAERLVVNKQRVQHGEARVRKEIVTEIQSIDVPVSHEELVIERHTVTGDAAVDDRPIADETIRIPLSQEQVTINKTTVVNEEVEIGTRRVEDVEHVSDTVRHEQLLVDGTHEPVLAPVPDPQAP